MLAALGVALSGLPAWGFDGARQISKSYLNPENFFDIQSFSFSKRENDRWYEAENGWRAAGGSLGLDLLYMLLEVKLRHPISESWSVGFEATQEEFYEIKPFRYLIEIEWQPQEWVGLSFVGMPEYDKRHGDGGGRVTFGSRPWNYVRLHRILHDVYYNEKNFYDHSTYDDHPVEKVWEGALRWEQWRLRTKISEVRPFIQRFPADQLTFTASAVDSLLVLDWQQSPDQLIGVTGKSFDIHKAREAPNTSVREDNRRQRLRYDSLNLYVLQPLTADWHGTFGVRWDHFRNELRDLLDGQDSEDFELWTLGGYGELQQSTSPTTAWEYGLYVGNIRKTVDHLPASKDDLRERKTEIKLRVNWLVEQPEQQGSLRFISSWDIDSLSFDSFLGLWDGGSIIYQRTF